MQKPIRAEWEAATAAGFVSNGSSCSPDAIHKVAIANGDNRWPPLPADLHDYRYHCGGTEEDRSAADAEFLDGLYDCVNHLKGPRREAARRRCRVYYIAVRQYGAQHWVLRDHPLTFEEIT